MFVIIYICVCFVSSLELRTPKTGSGTDSGEVTAATWHYFEEMHEVLGDRPSVDPPVVVSSYNEDPTPTPIVSYAVFYMDI